MASSNPITERIATHAASSEAGWLHIWLVDDHDDIRQALAKLLNLEPGVKCARQFPSAEAVLLALQEQSPDAILLDVDMPKMNGFQAVRPIKELAPATPVLMMATFFDSETRKQSSAAGAADFLLKSISPDEIVTAIGMAKSPRAFESRPY